MCAIHLVTFTYQKLKMFLLQMKKLANHLYPMSSWPWQKTFLPKESSEKETKYEGIGVELTSKTKCSYKWVKGACNPCKCKYQIFKNICCGQSFWKRFVAPKNVVMVHKQIDPWFFSLSCQLWSSFATLSSHNFL
jgi:hypothetical protein